MVCPLGNLPTCFFRTSHPPEFVARVRRYQSLPAPALQSRFENWNRILTVPVEVVLTPAAAHTRRVIELPKLVPIGDGALWARAKLGSTPGQGPSRRQ